MTTIDPRQQLAAALQSQVAALRARRPAGSSQPPKAQTQRTDQAALAQRLKGIAGEDPDRRQKAVRVFLESEFAREFGDSMLNDPAFGQMVDAVQAQMAGDAQTAAAVHALGDLLLASGG
ncbi:MAG TPA: hypothetical protein VHL79_18350 [Ramlibacter sp.]|jgi:hypothetical protein|nr:hypothetical protein [Ramlibacter sp.]